MTGHRRSDSLKGRRIRSGGGAPRVRGELLKLGINVSQPTVAKYMVRHRKPSSQTWRTFLTNHVHDLVSVDFFTVPTVTFRVFFVFIMLSHDRRRVIHFNVTEQPTAAWTAQQIEVLRDAALSLSVRGLIRPESN
jgi:putative transposase